MFTPRPIAGAGNPVDALSLEALQQHACLHTSGQLRRCVNCYDAAREKKLNNIPLIIDRGQSADQMANAI
jgi:hypothetical protein